MSERVAARRFNWFDLLTPDPAAGAAFYSAVVGWGAMNLGPQTNGYTLLLTARGAVGGVRRLENLNASAAWTGYVEVDDVDAFVPRIKAAGGVIRHMPVNVPGVLRFAAAEDPLGAPFMVYRGFGDSDPVAGEVGEPGFFAWHELRGREGASALDFYAALFGWARSADAPRDEASRIWTDGRGFAVGAMTSRSGDNQAPAWRFHIRVESLDAAAVRVELAGGMLMREPAQTASGEWTLEAADPQGAVFGLISSVR